MEKTEINTVRALRVRLIQDLNAAEASIEAAQKRLDAVRDEYEDVLQKIRSEEGTARSLRDAARDEYNEHAERIRNLCSEAR